MIFIKPHHFLDIIKLYGSDIQHFIPDPRYNHNFYAIGNLILKSPHVRIILTLKADDICKPCRFQKKGQCTDKIKDNAYISKEEWNQIIDQRIVKVLDFNKKNTFTSLEFCKLANLKLTPKIILEIWKERPVREIKSRIKFLIKGLNKYIKKFSI